MEDNGFEKLFLLEFLVDKVAVQKPGGLMDRLTTQNEWGSGEICVTFQFLDYPHLEICEQDFVSKMGDTSITNASFSSGKSCLFAVSNNQLETLPKEFEVNVGVLRKMPPGVLPDKLLLAQTKVELTEALSAVIDDVTRNPQEVPVTRRVRDSFDLMEPTGVKVVGYIGIFVRLTCFGKLIVTPFHLGGACDGGSSTFFGSGEDKQNLYHCTEVDASASTGVQPPHHVCQHVPAFQWPVWNGHPQGSPCCGDAIPSRSKEVAGPLPRPVALGGSRGECLCAEGRSPSACAPTRRKLKPCQEIGAEINGHALTIRVRKNKDADTEIMSMDDGNGCCCAVSENSMHPCACASKSSGSNPEGPGVTVQLPQKDGKPLCYRVIKCPTEAQGHDCNEQNDKPRDNFVLRIGKGKSHLELELQTPKKEGPRPLVDTLSCETQYVAAEAGTDHFIGKRRKGKKGKR